MPVGKDYTCTITAKAEKDLHWKAIRSIDDMAADAWRWQSQNPNGYLK